MDNAIRRGVHGIYKGNFSTLYLQARRATYSKKTTQTAFPGCGILSFNGQIVLSKLPQVGKDRHKPHVLAIMSARELGTLHNPAAVTRIIRQTKVQIAKEEDPIIRENFLESLVDRLARFGIKREKDYELVERSFAQWREANQLYATVDTRHLGTKKQNLAKFWMGKRLHASIMNGRSGI